MGSTPPAQAQVNTPLSPAPAPEHVESVSQVVETKTEAPLQQIDQRANRDYCLLKSSQSLNFEKTKNQAKIKKVKDIRSFQNLKGLCVQNDENQLPILELNHEEIEDVSILKKSMKQLNPVARKKMASDRIMISQQSKTQNVISSNQLIHNETRTNLDSRTKKCRVSKML